MKIGIFGVVSKIFVGKLFARNAAFRGMERQCAYRIMKTNYVLEKEFKADLTSKLQMVMEFGHFPVFPGNGWASGMEIGSFGVVSKTFLMKRFFRSVAFLRNAGEWAEWDCKANFPNKFFCRE